MNIDIIIRSFEPKDVIDLLEKAAKPPLKPLQAAGQPELPAGPFERYFKARKFERLEDKIQGPGLKGPQGMLIIGTDKYHIGHAFYSDGIDDAKSIHFRHLHVQKDKIGLAILDDINGLCAVRSIADDLNIRNLLEQSPKPSPGQRLVVHDENPERGLNCHVQVVILSPVHLNLENFFFRLFTYR
jgi:hypothetical protein